MSENNKRFVFSLSTEGTKLLEEGKVKLSSGGLRKPDGSVYEMAKPVLLDPDTITPRENYTIEDGLKNRLRATNEKLDLIVSDMSGLKDIAWMNYAVNCRTYEMTYQGFQIVIGQLNTVITQLVEIQGRMSNKEFYDNLQLVNKHKDNLKAIAGIMEGKRFNACDQYFNVFQILNDVHSYLLRMYNELKNGTGQEQTILAGITFLLEPYCYVVRRYSALYYYEAEESPANYPEWISVVNDIMRERYFREHLQHFLRVNSTCYLEDMYTARDKSIFNLRGYVDQIRFDKKYVLTHTKEQYLSIDKQLEDKVEAGQYHIIDGHMCIEI